MSFPSTFDREREFDLWLDFMSSGDSSLLTSVDDGGTGTNTLDATHGGTYTIKSAAADNDYHFHHTGAKNILIQASKSLKFAARFKLVEANTNAQNFFFGISSDVTSAIMGNDGAGPPSSYSGVGFHKLDGSLALQFETSNGSTQVTNASVLTLVSGQWYQIGFDVSPGDGTTAIVRPWAYDETAGVLYNAIKSSTDLAHRLAIAGLAQMGVIFGVKAGSASAEVLQVDYVGVRGTR